MTNLMATREAYGQALVEIGKENEDLVVMDADLSGSTKTAMFAKEFPNRFFNMGIAEQNLYGSAAGIALSGKVVCASTFAMFATGRAFEIVRNAIGYTGANVKICATHSGITVGEDGASHQTFEDLALMRTIPGMIVVNPADGLATQKLLRQLIEIEGPAYLRLGRSKVPFVYEKEAEIQIGKANILREGDDVAIIAAGIMVNSALEAADDLSAQGISARVIDMHTIKPVDRDVIIQAAKDIGRIVTAEEHSVIGGLGSAVCEVLCQEEPCKLAMVGQKDTFGESGTPDQLREKYGMTSKDIVKKVREVLND